MKREAENAIVVYKHAMNKKHFADGASLNAFDPAVSTPKLYTQSGAEISLHSEMKPIHAYLFECRLFTSWRRILSRPTRRIFVNCPVT